jgi:dUTP pyrophosphatase
MDECRIDITYLPHGEGLNLPSYATAGAAGMDIAAAIDTALVLAPGEREAVSTGFCLAIPEGYEVQVRPRSGLAFKYGVTVANAPGTIDGDYRGEIKVLLINLGAKAFTINRGDRIAQMVVAPFTQASLNLVDMLDDTARGAGGFGSTGRE